MSILKTKVLPALNGEVRTSVKEFAEVTNDKGGYVSVTLTLPDREFTYTIFPGKDKTEGRQINYFVSAISRQLGLEEEFELGDFLSMLKEQDIQFNTYFSYDAVYGRLNVGFHEPLVVQEIDLEEVDV